MGKRQYTNIEGFIPVTDPDARFGRVQGKEMSLLHLLFAFGIKLH
jgi:hypothetical protein